MFSDLRNKTEYAGGILGNQGIHEAHDYRSVDSAEKFANTCICYFAIAKTDGLIE